MKSRVYSLYHGQSGFTLIRLQALCAEVGIRCNPFRLLSAVQEMTETGDNPHV